MKLNDLSRFCRFGVGDAEKSFREVLVIFRCEEFDGQPDIMKLEFLSFSLGPIWMALDLSLFDEFVEHEDCF